MRCSDGRSGARPGHHCPHRGSASEHRSYADSDNDFFTEKILMTHEEFEASQMRNIKEALFQSTSGEYEDMLRRMKEKYGERLYRDMTDEEFRDLEAKEAAFFAAKKQAKPQPEPEVDPIYTSEFKGWFGDWEDDAENASKVVDDDGYPLVVYHGTPKAGFEAFDRERLGKSSWHSTAQLGFFFSSERVANGFTGLDKFYDPPEAAGIYPVYLNMRNPYEISAEDFHDTYLMPEGVEDSRDGEHPVIQENVSHLAKELAEGGHDGIIIKAAEFSNAFEELHSTNFVVFSPEQIKSVFNRGTWDGNDPRILFQTAHHGSPHKFDKFSLEHIGSGEGAQAFGWGLYFAGRRGIAEDYRKTLSAEKEKKSAKDVQIGRKVYRRAGEVPDYISQGKNRYYEGKVEYEAITSFLRNNRDKQKALDELQRRIDYYKNSGEVESDSETKWHASRLEKAYEFLETADIKEAQNFKKDGQLYEVDIPEDDVLLLWDSPLSGQPEKVVKALEGIGIDTSPQQTGEQLYRALAKHMRSPRAASEHLNSLGVKGIKYFDGTSRRKGEGTYNFVVFDDKAISIINTYYQSQTEAALERDVAAWKKTVDDFVEGNVDRKQRSLQLLSQTPLAFTLVGARQLPVNTKASVLRKAIYEKHKLTPELVKQVAEKLADPVMIVRSTGEDSVSDITVMLDLTDENKASVVVPVIFSDTAHGYEMNFAPSIYAKNDGQTKAPSNKWFEEQLRAGNVLYANRKKVKGWNRIAKRQLPGWNSIPNAKTIKFEDALVKLREQYPAHYSRAAGTARGGMRKMADGRYVVGLFKKADASTILHETAHFWLEELREAAGLEAAPEWVHDAWAKLQAAYGFEGFLDGKNAEGVAAWTGVQERFAREFEAYAREGKAPSWELQSAFNKFRNWLTEIYRTVRKLLGAHGVSEDAREVFDVLLATEEEIALSQRRASENSVMDLLEEEVSPELRDRHARNEASILWARRTSTMLTPEQRKDFENHKEPDAEMSRQYANYPPFAEFKKTERYARACASVRDDLRKEPEPPDNEEIEYHVLRRYMRFGPGSWPFETPNGPELLATDADGTQHWGFR